MIKISYPDKSFWSIVVISIICGLAAGILGAIASRLYIIQDFFPSDVDLSNLSAASSGLVIRDPRNVIVSADVKVAETVDSLQPVIVGIFEALETDETSDYYDLEKPLFTGLIITADGWAVAQPPAERKKDFTVENYVAIASDRRLYSIDRLAALSGLPGDPLIFHLSGAANLPVKKIVSRAELSLGETLLVVTGRRSVWPTVLTSLTRPAAILSSDSLSARLTLLNIDANDWRNSFVFDMAGNLVAVISGDETITPAFSYNSLLADLTQSQPVARPSLGVNYLDLSAVRMSALNLERGALIYQSGNQPGVVKGGPAEAAGLEDGDIITWVNNQEINAEHDLADLITGYRSGDKITLTYIRAGQEKVATVELGISK